MLSPTRGTALWAIMRAARTMANHFSDSYVYVFREWYGSEQCHIRFGRPQIWWNNTRKPHGMRDQERALRSEWELFYPNFPLIRKNVTPNVWSKILSAVYLRVGEYQLRLANLGPVLYIQVTQSLYQFSGTNERLQSDKKTPMNPTFPAWKYGYIGFYVNADRYPRRPEEYVRWRLQHIYKGPRYSASMYINIGSLRSWKPNWSPCLEGATITSIMIVLHMFSSPRLYYCRPSQDGTDTTTAHRHRAAVTLLLPTVTRHQRHYYCQGTCTGESIVDCHNTAQTLLLSTVTIFHRHYYPPTQHDADITNVTKCQTLLLSTFTMWHRHYYCPPSQYFTDTTVHPHKMSHTLLLSTDTTWHRHYCTVTKYHTHCYCLPSQNDTDIITVTKMSHILLLPTITTWHRHYYCHKNVTHIDIVHRHNMTQTLLLSQKCHTHCYCPPSQCDTEITMYCHKMSQTLLLSILKNTRIRIKIYLLSIIIK